MKQIIGESVNKNRLVVIVLLVILLITACQPAVQPTQPAQAQPLQTNTPYIVQTTTPALAVSPVPTVSFTASPPSVCEVVPVVPTIDPQTENLIPPVSKEDWTYGIETAEISIVYYCNYQNPLCAILAKNLAELQSYYPKDIRITFRNYPQADLLDKSLLAARGAEAAGIQNLFWQMYNALMTRQSEWSSLTETEFMDWMTNRADLLGIPAAQFRADIEKESVNEKINAMIAGGEKIGITNTPALFINGWSIVTKVDIESLEGLIKYFLMKDKGFAACPKMVIDSSKNYTATFKTEKGDIVIELFADKAPQTVNSFIFLANEGWFDNTPFYRVVPGYLVQAGDPSGSALGNPGYQFTDEISPELRFDKPGVVAMENQGKGINGSQFFITYTELPALDGQFTIFGQVISGMDVLSSLRPRDPQRDQLILPADQLLSVAIEVN